MLAVSRRGTGLLEGVLGAAGGGPRLLRVGGGDVGLVDALAIGTPHLGVRSRLRLRQGLELLEMCWCRRIGAINQIRYGLVVRRGVDLTGKVVMLHLLLFVRRLRRNLFPRTMAGWHV